MLFNLIPWLLLDVGSLLGPLAFCAALLISRQRNGSLYQRWDYLLRAALLWTVASGAMNAFFVEQIAHAR
jgi:hypothetical protein